LPANLDLEDPYVSYGYLPASVDLAQAWRRYSQAAQGRDLPEDGFPVLLGRVNRVTAQHTQVAWWNAADQVDQRVSLVPVSSVAESLVQQWEIRWTDANQREALVGHLATTQQGLLQARLLPADEAWLDSLSHAKLFMFYGEQEVSHTLGLGAGPLTPWGPDLVTIQNGGSLARDGSRETQLGSEPTPSLPIMGTIGEEGTQSDVGPSVLTVPDLGFDPRRASLKPWVLEDPIDVGQGLELRIWIADQAMRPLDRENPTWQALRFRGTDQPYIVDEMLDIGSVVLTVRFETARRLRVQGHLHLLTPQGLKPLRSGVAQEAAQEAEKWKMTLQAQYDQRRTVRARPGEGDLKQMELNRLEALMKETDRYLQALNFALDHTDQILEDGLAFEIHRVDFSLPGEAEQRDMGDSEQDLTSKAEASLVVRSQGRQPPNNQE